MLSTQEAAVYDRQLRVWGVEAQQRLRQGKLLVLNMTPVLAEVCKNVVLAGVGTVVLLDDGRRTSEMDFETNFLLRAAPQCLSGAKDRSVVETCALALRDMNPFVSVETQRVKLDGAGIPQLPLESPAVVLVGRCSHEQQAAIAAQCRAAGPSVAFVFCDLRGPCGRLFLDLQRHACTAKKAGASGSIAQQPLVVNFPSFQEAHAAPFSSMPRKPAANHFAFQLLEDFESAGGRSPAQPFDAAALQALLLTAQEGSSAHGPVPASLRAEVAELLRLMAEAGAAQAPAVAAVVGGIAGQEIVKAVSKVGSPLCNFFHFDSLSFMGMINRLPAA